MPKLSRKGDQNQVGGEIVRGAKNVFCNGKPVGLHVSSITPHPSKGKHKNAVTTSASETVFCEGSPVLKEGSGNDCGHSIAQGSNNVFVP